MKRARFVLPTLKDIAPKLAGAWYFSKLDVASGFWQIPPLPDSVKLTVFITPLGRFCFKRLPFGITSAPETFQCLLTDKLKNEEGCEAIMDDIIVFGRSAEEHDENLNGILQVIKESRLKLNKAKCKIKKDSLTYFGHVPSARGLSPYPEKVKRLQSFKHQRVSQNYAELSV